MAEEGTAQPGAAAHGGDPSMEDILASIRRILNEDEPSTPAANSSASPEPLTLTEDMLVAEEPEVEPEAEPLPPPTPIAAPIPVSAPIPLPPAPYPLAPPPPAVLALPADALLAPAAAAAASASIGSLVRAVSQDRDAAVTRGGPSIEDVVREEVRPLLKAWLDQHLPELVERLVRAEIERVVRRGLG